MSFGSPFGRMSSRRKKAANKGAPPEVIHPEVKGPIKERIAGSIGAVQDALPNRVIRPFPILVEPPPSAPQGALPDNPNVPPRQAPRHGIAVIGRFSTWPWGQHPDEAYLADALEQIGLMVYRVDQESLPSASLPAELALFTGHPQSLEHLPTWRQNYPTVVWTLDWLPDFPERRPMSDAGRSATIFLTSDQYAWKENGIPHHRYLPGACESISFESRPQPTIPCAFIGSLYNERRERIAEMIRNRGGELLTQASTWKYGKELASWLQSVKVLVGDNFRNDIQGYWSTRNYIVPGAGGFLLTPNVPGLGLQFKLDREVAVYDSLENLDKRLDFWILNDEAREAVRKAGYARVHREHTWKNRAIALLMHIAEKLNATH